MGNTIEQHRAAIGAFSGGRGFGKSCFPTKLSKTNKTRIQQFMAIVTLLLLVTAGLETNPGPTHAQVTILVSSATDQTNNIWIVKSLLSLLGAGRITVQSENLRYVL